MISIEVKILMLGYVMHLPALLPGLDGYFSAFSAFSDFFLDQIYGMGSASAEAIRPYNKL